MGIKRIETTLTHYTVDMGKSGPPYTFDINEMLVLRAEGWNYSDLGRKYGKDHTTILYHCKKFGVVAPPKKIVIKEAKTYVNPIFIPKKEHKYDYIINEKVNAGKSYKMYLKDAKKKDNWYATHAKTTLATHPPGHKA